MDLVHIIAYSSFLSPLIPLLATLFVKRLTMEIKWLSGLLIVAFLMDMFSLMLIRMEIPTFPLVNFYSLFELILLLWIYEITFLNNRKIFWIICGTYALFFLTNYGFIQTPFLFNSYSFTLTALILTIFALLYFKYLLERLPVNFIHRTPMVWINIGVLVYFSGNLFLFILNNFFTVGEDGNQRYMWILHNFLNILKNLLFLIAVVQQLRQVKSEKQE
jgi:hypothetical protein